MLKIRRIFWYNWNNSQRYANSHPYYSNWKFILIRSIFCLNLFTVRIYTNNWILEQRKYYIISLKTYLFVCGLISSFCKKKHSIRVFCVRTVLVFSEPFLFFPSRCYLHCKKFKDKSLVDFSVPFFLHYLVLPRYFYKPEGNFWWKNEKYSFEKKNCWFPVQ